jgi:hypothetical protein
MKKTALFALVLMLSVVMGMTGLGWAFEIQKLPAPAPALKPPTAQTTLTPPPPKMVFVTSVTCSGQFGGVSGGDDICNALARTAGLTGTFKAWLSSSGVPEVSPATSFTHSTGPYVLRDGSVIADSWGSLVSGIVLKHPINIDEKGIRDTTGSASVWTGTDKHGRKAGENCNNWTVGWKPFNGQVGLRYVPYAWTVCGGSGTAIGCATKTCDGQAHLYCFQQ